MNKKLKSDFPNVDSGILHQDGSIPIGDALPLFEPCVNTNYESYYLRMI